MKRYSPAFAKCLIAAALASPSLTAQTQNSAQQNDWKLLAQVQKVLADEHAFVGSSIMPSVNRGVVTLTGNVRSEAEKTLASSELANIDGIKTVLNNLNVADHTFHAPPPVAGPSGPVAKTVPAGTTIPIRLITEIDTKTAKANDPFTGTTAAEINIGGYVLIPSGSTVTGRIVDAKAAGHFSGSAELAMKLLSVRLPSPQGPQDVAMVTQQLSNKAQGRGGNTVAKAGGGAAAGAVIGALAGGGAGAGIGAASGGALGLGVNALTRGKEIDLKPEQLLQFQTTSAIPAMILLKDGHQVLMPPAQTAPLQPRPQLQPSDVTPPPQ